LFLVGRDTRVSGPLLQAALSAGLASEGAEVRDLGVMPTPGVAALSAALMVPAAVISASHNPFSDNGIKLFAAGGRKLSDDVEQQLEAELGAILDGTAKAAIAPTGLGVGRLSADPLSLDWYEEHLLASLEGRRLEGIKVALDCANGAASVTAADVFTRAGADVVAVLAAAPDGININDACGSTFPAGLQAAVVEHGSDVGLAFDGDADRVIAVDHTGALVDGDQLIALFALDMRDRGRLAQDTVVVTVMTNLGFRIAMGEHGIHVHETEVGDRYVLEALDEGDWSLGGEQSGHVIFRELATTGDGVLTGLQLLDQVVRRGRRLGELAGAAMSRLPQVLRSVRVADLGALAGAGSIWAAVAEVESELGRTGRVLLRSSGTERLVRVMVEAPTESVAQAATSKLISAVTSALGADEPHSG